MKKLPAYWRKLLINFDQKKGSMLLKTKLAYIGIIPLAMEVKYGEQTKGGDKMKRFIMLLMVAAIMTALAVTPAFADNNCQKEGGQDVLVDRTLSCNVSTGDIEVEAEVEILD